MSAQIIFSEPRETKTTSHRREVICGEVGGVEVVVDTLQKNLCIDSKYLFKHKAEREAKREFITSRLRAKLAAKKAKAGQ